jgi:hypothetical protein
VRGDSSVSEMRSIKVLNWASLHEPYGSLEVRKYFLYIVGREIDLSADASNTITLPRRASIRERK